MPCCIGSNGSSGCSGCSGCDGCDSESACGAHVLVIYCRLSHQPSGSTLFSRASSFTSHSLIQPLSYCAVVDVVPTSSSSAEPLLDAHSHTGTLAHLHPPLIEHRHALLHPLPLLHLLLMQHPCSTSYPALLYFLLILYTMLHFIRCSSNVEYAQLRPLPNFIFLIQHTLLYFFNPAVLHRLAVLDSLISKHSSTYLHSCLNTAPGQLHPHLTLCPA